jgi:hypothetical protein
MSNRVRGEKALQQERLRCAYDICNKRLGDFAFVSQQSGSLYCSETCGERDVIEREPAPVRVQ